MEKLTLKEIQSESYKVLLKIKDICEKNNLKYSLIYGTLLGAVRHNGFIPWDDDIDIMMPRPDYEKFIDFCRIYKKEIKPYELKHYSTCEKYVYTIARLSDSRYIADYKNTKDYGLGCFVDIYPFDGININDKKQLRKLKRVRTMIFMRGQKKFQPSKAPLKNFIKFPMHFVVKGFNLNRLLRKSDTLGQKYSYEKSEYISCTVWENEVFKKTLFDNLILHKFENDEFYIPIDCDTVLRTIYGDYMQLPPETKRVGQHYYEIYRK